MVDFNDEFAGMGGSFVIDPKTGKRRRADEPVAPAAEPASKKKPKPESEEK